MQSTMTTIAHHGVTLPALVCAPDSDGPPRPAVVIAAEAYGLNQFTREVAAGLVDAGYIVVVPDYYRGNGLTKPDDYSDFTEVMGFIDGLDFVGATRDVLAGIDHARAMPEVDPDRVAVWGYCTGSTLAMLASALDRRLAATVLFFPSQPTFPELNTKRPVHPIDLLWGVSSPLLLIIGDQDPLYPDEVLSELRDRLERWQVDHEIRIYEGAGHAFSAPVPPLRHDTAAVESWADAVGFVNGILRP